MANPQLEHGYTRIANEILEVIAKIKMSPTQYRLIYVIWRYTYGFNRREHNMSLSFFEEATECDKRNIQRELKRLEERNIIKQNIGGNKRMVSFNKNYNEWDSDMAIGKTTIGEIDNGEIDNWQIDQPTIGETDNATIGEIDNQERNKDNIKEMPIENFFEELWSLYPRKKGKSKVSKKQKKKLYEEVGYEKMKKAITKYKEETKDREEKFIMYGSTFFNSGYLDYLPVEANTKEIVPTGKTRILTDEDIQKDIQELESQKIEQAKANRGKIRYVEL